MSESYSLISAREHYLMQPVVDAFTDYLAEYIAGRVFDPPYLTQTYRPKAQYCFTSLEDAWEQYIQEAPNREFQNRLIHRIITKEAPCFNKGRNSCNDLGR